MFLRLVSCCSPNELPQDGLQQQKRLLTVLESRSLKSHRAELSPATLVENLSFVQLLAAGSLASLVVHMAENPPAMQETWVQSLGQEDPLEKEMATHSRNPMDREAWWGLQSMRSQRAGPDWGTDMHSRAHLVAASLRWLQALSRCLPFRLSSPSLCDSLICIRLSVTPETTARQAPLSMEFSLPHS